MNERERSEGDCGTLTPGHALFQTFVGTRAWHQAQDFWARTIESSASVVEGDDPDDFLPAWVRGEQFYPHGDRSSLGSSSSVHAKGGKQLSPELSLHAAFTPWEKALLQDASRSLHSSHNTASASSCSSCRSSSSHSVMDSKTPPIPSYYGVNQLAILNHAGYKSGEFDSKNLRYIYRQTYAIRIGYVGSAYHGYQAQKRMHEGIRTVEEDVNLALGSTSCAAGRTDREVSAVSQVIGCVIKDPSLVGESHCRRLADDAVSLVSSVSRPAARSSRERSAIYRNAQQAQRNRAVFHSIEGTDDQAGAQKELDIKAGLDLEEAQSGTAETRSRKRVRSPSAVSSEPSAAAGTYSGGNVGDAIGPRSSACSGSRSVSCEENAKNVDKQEEEEGDRIRESILHRMRGSEPCRAGRLAVYDCYRVPRSFNARASATWRRYLYLFPLSASSDSTIERSSSSSSSGGGSPAFRIDLDHLNRILNSLVTAGPLPYNAFAFSADRARSDRNPKTTTPQKQEQAGEEVEEEEEQHVPPTAKAASGGEHVRHGKEQEGGGGDVKEATKSQLDVCTLYLARAFLVDLQQIRESSNNRSSSSDTEVNMDSSAVLDSGDGTKSGEGLAICVELVGSRFLRRMVRKLAATALRECWTELSSSPQLQHLHHQVLNKIETKAETDTETKIEGEKGKEREKDPIPPLLLGESGLLFFDNDMRFLYHQRAVDASAANSSSSSNRKLLTGLEETANVPLAQRKAAGCNEDEVLVDICRKGDRSNSAQALPGSGLCFAGVGFNATELALYKYMPRVKREAFADRLQVLQNRVQGQS